MSRSGPVFSVCDVASAFNIHKGVSTASGGQATISSAVVVALSVVVVADDGGCWWWAVVICSGHGLGRGLGHKLVTHYSSPI